MSEPDAGGLGMMVYQKCPVCDGTGLVSRPPEVAGDVREFVSNGSGPWRCETCQGQRVIYTSRKERE